MTDKEQKASVGARQCSFIFVFLSGKYTSSSVMSVRSIIIVLHIVLNVFVILPVDLRRRCLMMSALSRHARVTAPSICTVVHKYISVNLQ